MAAKEKLVEPQVTLDEFCIRRSNTDKRTELLAGFHYDELDNDRVKDTESNYLARLDAYAKRPVGE